LIVFLLIILPTVTYFLGKQAGAARSASLANSMNSTNIPPAPPTATPIPPTPTLAPVATNSGTLIADNTSDWKIYKNSKYGFSIKYPNTWLNQEYLDATGSTFATSAANLQSGDVTIRTMAKPTDHVNDLFVNYVPIAAIQEIQGYSALVSNKQLTTTSGVVGYQTTWTRTYINGQSGVSTPITYFQIPSNNSVTIQVFLNQQVDLTTYEEMLSTFQLTQ
jgi:hypothetical protein